jgi:hypothetical protein
MFWNKQKSREQEIAEQLKIEAFEIVAALTPHWVRYQTLVPFAPNVLLPTRVVGFLMQAHNYVSKNHPLMKTAPPAMIEEMAWLAVIESGTHTVPQVNEARAKFISMTDREKVSAEGTAVVAFLKGKWIYFCNALSFRDDVPLSDRIAAFVPPAREGVGNNFHEYRDAPMELILSMVSVAIMNSGTHDPNIVADAVEQLKSN